MKSLVFGVWIAVVGMVVAGCVSVSPAKGMDAETPPVSESTSPTTAPTAAPNEEESAAVRDLSAEAQALVDLAIADLARKLEAKAGDIELLSVQRTQFRDASLGVPEPDKMYAQVITPGYILQLGVEDTVHTYHGSNDRVVWVPEDSVSP